MTNPMTNPTNPSDEPTAEPGPSGAEAVPAPGPETPAPEPAEAAEPGASPESIVDPPPPPAPAAETVEQAGADAETTELSPPAASQPAAPEKDVAAANQPATELGEAPEAVAVSEAPAEHPTVVPPYQPEPHDTAAVPPLEPQEPTPDETAPFPAPVAEESPTVVEPLPPVTPPLVPPPHHHGRHEEAHDRVWPHFLWELLLLLGVGVLAAIYWAQETPGFEVDQLKPLWWSATVLGILAVGFSFSLRAGAPNLAVAPIAVASSVLAAMGARERDWDEWTCIAIAVATAALAGLILGLVIVVLQVPAWAASLGAGFAVLAWTVNSVESDPRLIEPARGGPDLYDWWVWIFAGVALVSVIGGILWTIPGFRAACSARPNGDPADRPSASAAFGVLAAMTFSSAAAAAAGGFLWINDRPTKDTGPTLLPGELLGPLSTNGLFLLLVTFGSMVLAVVLLGGTSAFGRRGGVFGTVLAVAGMVLLHEVTDVSHATFWYFTAGAIGVGLVATRLLERVGKQSAPEQLSHGRHSTV